MLEYNENTHSSKVLAAYYARKLDNELLLNFMLGEADLISKEQAESVITGFWQMTDMAIEDSHADKEVEGIADIEFWMHKLFNKVYGYMTKNGYRELWDKSMEDR